MIYTMAAGPQATGKDLPRCRGAGGHLCHLLRRAGRPHLEVAGLMYDAVDVATGLPQAERDQALTPTGSITANPGGTDNQLFKLLPGRYGIACLNPQGSTAAQDGTGPPHATLGEAVEINVQ